MTVFRSIAACAVLITPVLSQDIAPKDSERDPLLSSLMEGNDDESTGDISADPPSLMPEDHGTPVLVTGKPPSDAQVTDEEPVAPEPEGVTVNVEPGKDNRARVDSGAVKLLAPFPAKPLFSPPAGWKLEHPEEVPTFVREVKLSSGTSISLAIRPHLLVPDADGQNVLSVHEPGYDPALRYAQTSTMSAVLGSSVEKMEEDSRKMSAALERLSQLLGSLPAAAAAAEAPPGPETSPNKKQR